MMVNGVQVRVDIMIVIHRIIGMYYVLSAMTDDEAKDERKKRMEKGTNLIPDRTGTHKLFYR